MSLKLIIELIKQQKVVSVEEKISYNSFPYINKTNIFIKPALQFVFKI